MDIEDPDPALADLALSVRIKADGTPAWDTDSNAGNDSGPNNGIVRVNDTVTYTVEYAVPTTSAANATFVLKFPKGMEITELPGYCLSSGSSINPATAGEPTIPLTATSIDQLSEQTLTCNRGTISSGTDAVDISVKVLNVAHQGQDLQIQQAQMTAEGLNGIELDAPQRPSVKASARLMWDISKNGTALTENTGYLYGPANVPCPWNAALNCKQTTYHILLSAPAGGKGAMPAIGDVTFTDDLSPEAMYPGLDESSIAAIKADLNKYGSRIATSVTNYAVPGAEIGGSQEGIVRTALNSVRNSGGLNLAQAGPGQPVKITISGADFSLRSFPSEAARPAGTALPGTAAYAVSRGISVYTPIDTIRDFGTQAGTDTTWTLETFNSYKNLSINGFEATDTQGSADQPGPNATKLPSEVPGPINWNDYRTTSPNIALKGTFKKSFMGFPGAEGNMNPTDFVPGNSILGEGPPGGATWWSGSITVAPTQKVTSFMHFIGSTPAAPAPVSTIGCDAWDNTGLNLVGAESGSVGGGLPGIQYLGAMQRVPSQGAPVWVSGYNNVPGTIFADDKSQVPDIKIQYSAKPGVAKAATLCTDAEGPWFDNPADVPGNDPELLQDNVYTAVSRVRVFATLPPSVSNSSLVGDGVYLVVSIGLRVADTGLPTGKILPNYGGAKIMIGEDLTPEQMLQSTQPWTQLTYDPVAHVGGGGDRLILAQAQVRIDKQVRKGDSGSFSDTPPQTTGGDLVQYRLAPSITSGATTPGILKDVWVEDCLPVSQTYANATRTPVVVVPNVTPVRMPADAKRPACADGETYIRWVFEDHEVNKAIEPIIMSVNVSPSAEDGASTNSVVVWAKDDSSSLRQRTDTAGIQVANIRGVRISKDPLTPVVQVNRDGQSTNELNEWSVKFANRLPGDAPVPNDPDMIDVLPKQGRLGSNFSGTFTFDSAEVTEGNAAGQTVKLSYTKATNPNDDPRVATNGATGATIWCDAPSGGAVVSGSGTAAGCPASKSEVTAVRVQRPGPFSSGSAMSFTVRMVAIGNHGGDTYVNQASGFATGLENLVRSPEAPEIAIESVIGDTTWWDANRNGIQDQFNGVDEPRAKDIGVRLSGTDDLGNAVSANAVTDAQGKYTFSHLRSSNDAGYTVTFVKPDGSEFTIQTAGDDPAVDSNADPETGIAAPVVLGRSTQDLTIDAGFVVASVDLLIKKVGESDNSTWVGMDGSSWAIFNDDNGVKGTPYTGNEVTAVVPTVAGLFELKDISAGTYWLVETKAPAGFNLLAEPAQFTIAGNGDVSIGQGSGDGVVTAEDTEGTGTFTITVRDVPALELPESGGAGSQMFLVGGSIILILALLMALGTQRRRRIGSSEMV